MRNIWYFTSITLFACGQYLTFGADVNVRTQIEDISRSALTSNVINHEYLERQLLNLLSGDSNPESRGAVYATIANIYGRDMDNHYEKAAHYAREALKEQINVIEVCDMYLCLGKAIEVRARRSGETLNSAEVENQAQPYIQGLALVLDRLRVDKNLPPPSVGKFDVDQRDPQYQEIVRQHDKEMAGRNDILQQNRLLSFREDFGRRVLVLYSRAQVNASAFDRVVRDAVDNTDSGQKVLRFLRSMADKQGKSR